MYAAAERIDPDTYLALARATFAEMALAGITLVGEFHYVHHGPEGERYADPNAMGEAVIEAASEAGIRITLLDACYLHGGIGEEPEGAQRRFCDPDVDGWAERVSALSERPGVRIGAAIHSIRAVDPASAATVASWGPERPLHAHVSEQPAENEACLAAYGATPAAALAKAGARGGRFTAVHATHLTEEDFGLLGEGSVCLCPTTERDLADGIGPARSLAEAGARLCTGTDSNALIDPFEEARAIELDERLATGVRGNHSCAGLLTAASAGGYSALGWPDGGRIEAGALADLVTVGLEGVRLAGTDPEHALASVLFAASPADVREVIVAGAPVVRGGRHVSLDVEAELASSVAAVAP
jgi:formiminoglutamate deiminase